MKGAFTLARAMELVYGSYDYSEMVSRWTSNETRNYPNSWPDTVTVRPLIDTPYVEDGTAKHLLVTWAIPKEGFQGEFTCHSCAPMIGFILFAKKTVGWVVEDSDLEFGTYGEFGRPPSLSIQPIGTNRYGVAMTTSFGSTGEWEQSVTIVIPADGKFLKAFSAQTEGSDDWGCSRNAADERKNRCVAYDGDIDMLPASGSEYFELLLTKRVYRSFSKAQPAGTTLIKYRFDGAKYVLEK